MSLELGTILFLFVYILIREGFFMYSSQKMINKLMSKNFYEYQVSEKIGKDKPKAKPVHPQDEGMMEDLNHIL